VYSAES